MNRVLLDQGLAPNTAALSSGLRREWDAIHVSEVGMSSADDEEILLLGSYAGTSGPALLSITISILISR